MSVSGLKESKVIVGLSGGVDSSVALLLLKKQGFSPVGLTLRLPIWEDPESLMRENICCTAEGIRFVKRLCLKLDVPYHVLDCREEFERIVVDYFVKEYREGKTPNPCMVCNKYLRFPKFFEFAKKQGADFVATGHYVRKSKIKNQKSKVIYRLLRAKDKKKDQSYFLALLSQEELSRLLFPVGEYTKEGVYQIAKKEGWGILQQRPQSQDFCFVTGESKDAFLEEKIGKRPGPVVNIEGKLLGEHKGLHFYTIGQRKGIGFPGGPFWVIGFNPGKNAVIVSRNEDDLYKKEFFVKDIHWVSNKEPQFPFRVKVKIRYRHEPASAIIWKMENLSRVLRLRSGQALSRDGKWKIVFTKPQRAITPGQYAVFYLGDICLGGGVIVEG